LEDQRIIANVRDRNLFGPIVAIADVYDALSTARVYKKAWDESDVVAKIHSETGRQFDPELVEIFLSCLNILRSIQKRYRDTEN
jgi:response regulator RpfG family c-di-GMP phosphodiesterase